MAARHPSAEELIAALDSIIERYRQESGRRGPSALSRRQAIDCIVELGFSEGDAVRYLDRNRAKPAVSHG